MWDTLLQHSGEGSVLQRLWRRPALFSVLQSQGCAKDLAGLFQGRIASAESWVSGLCSVSVQGKACHGGPRQWQNS